MLSAVAPEAGVQSATFDLLAPGASSIEINDPSLSAFSDASASYDPAAELENIFGITSDLEAGIDPADSAESATVINSGESLTGNLETAGDLINHGLLSPGNSPGVINHNGDLTQNGTLLVEIGGRTAGAGSPNVDDGYDQLNVSGNLTLGGTLQIQLLNGFVPVLGDSFEFINAGSISGDFVNFSGLNLGEGLYLKPVLDGNRYLLTVAELPGGASDVDAGAQQDALLAFFAGKGAVNSFSFFGRLNLSHLVSLSGNFAIERGPSLTVPLADGSTTQVQNLTLGGSDIHAFIGWNGPYWQDSDDDGDIDSTDETVDGAVGLAIEDLDFGLGLFASILDLTGYMALQAHATSISIVGLDGITIRAEDVSFGLNLASNPFEIPGVFEPEVIDFSAMNGGAGLSIATGGDPVSLTFDDSVLQVTAGNALLQISNFLSIEGSFAFEQGRTVEVTLADGTTKEVETMTIGAADVDVFAGVGGPYFDDLDGNGNGYNDGAIGIALENVDVGVALMEGADLTDFTKYVALKVEADSAALVGMGDIIELSATDITVGYNTVSDLFDHPLDPAEPIDFSAMPGGGFAVPTGGDPVVLDFDSELLQVIVGQATLKISDFLFIQGSFAFEQGRTVEVTLADGEVKEVDAVTIGASNVNVFAGVGGPYFRDVDGNGNGYNDGAIGIALQNVDVGIALLEGADLTDFTKYVAIKVEADSAGLVGMGDIIELSATDITVGYNTVSDPFDTVFDPAEPIDFSAMQDGGFAVPTGGDPVVLDFDSELLQVIVGQATLKISDFLFIQGSFAFEKGRSTEVTLADGETKEVDVVTIGASNVNVFAGAGGPYFEDVDGDGDGRNDNSIGIALENVDLGIALLEGADLTDFTKYVALKIEAESAGVVGLGDIFELTAEDVTVGYNTVSDPFDTVFDPAEPIDFSAMPGGGFAVPTGGDPVVLDFDSELLQVIVGQATLQISEFIFVQGSFAFEQGRSATVTLADGTTKEVDAVTIGASDVNVFAGLGGPYFEDVDGDGDGRNDGAIGLAFENVDVGIALFEGAALTDFTKYVALKVEADSAGFVGMGDIIELNARDITIGYNTVTDPFDTVFDPAEPIDFSAMTGGGFAVPTGGDPVVLDFDSELLQVIVGQATLKISQFIFIQGSFAFEQGRTTTVTLADSTTKEVDVITIGASNVNVFAGVGGPYFEDVDGDGDGRNDGSIGLALENVDVGIGLFEGADLFDFTKYVAVKVEADSAGLVGMGDILELSAQDIRVGYNSVDDPFDLPTDPAEPIDFSAMTGGGFAVPTGGDPVVLDYDSELIQVILGQATLKISDFIFVEGSFAFEKGRSTEVTLADGETKEVDVMTIGASNVNVFAGIGGSYFDDLDGNGDGYNANAIGLVLENVDVGVVMMEGAALTDFAKYMALKVEAESAGLVGLGDVLELRIRDITVGYNSVDDPIATPFNPAEPIDFSAMPDGGFEVPTGGDPVVLDFDSELLQVIIGDAYLKISDFIQIRGSFAFEKGRTLSATLSGPDPLTFFTQTKELEQMTIGASNVNVFVGLGPYWLDADGDGQFDAQTNDRAVGIALENVTFGLGIYQPERNPLVPSSLLDLSKYYAFKGHADRAAIVGINDPIEIDFKDITVAANLARNSLVDSIPGGSLIVLPAIDFTELEGGGYEVLTGGEPVFFDFNGPRLQAVIGDATIRISEFVHLHGSLALEAGDVQHVELSSPDLVFGSEKDVRILTLGGYNIQAFVGINGPYRTDVNGDGLINNADPANTSAVGLVLDDVSFAMAILKPTSLIDPAQYFALKATANQIGFVGIDAFEISGRELVIEVNNVQSSIGNPLDMPVVDFAASFPDSGGYEVRTGAKRTDPDTGELVDITIPLTMSSRLIHAQAAVLNVNIGGVVALTGGFDFSLGATNDVTLTNGLTKRVTTMTVGATNVYGFVGINGPYWRDSNNDGQIITDPNAANHDTPDSDAIGLSLEDLDLGLAIMVPTFPLDVSRFVALKANVDRVQLVGLNFVTLDIEDIQLEANLGYGISVGVAAVDFPASFPADPQNNKPDAGLFIDTGHDGVLLDFDDLLIRVRLAGELTFRIPDGADLFSISGVFLFAADTSGLQLFADGGLSLAVPGGDVLSLETTGVLFLNGDGFAADLDVDLSLSPGIESVFALNAGVRLVVNVTGQTQRIQIPDNYLQFLNDQTRNRLITDSEGSSYYEVNRGPPRFDGSFGSSGPYLVVIASGTISVGGPLAITGLMRFEASGDYLELSIAASLTIDPVGSASVFGTFRISSDGFVASLDAVFVPDANIASNLGITLSAQFKLEINTRPTDDTIVRPVINKETGAFTSEFTSEIIPALTLRLYGGGALQLVGAFDIVGQFEFSLGPGGLMLGIDGFLDVTFLGQLALSGVLAIGQDGVVASLDISAGLGDGFGAAVGLKFQGRVTLQINTTGSTKIVSDVEVDPGVLLSISGSVDFLGFASASGQMTIAFSGSELRMTIRATVVLGPIDVQIDGFGIFNSSGIVLDLAVSLETSVLDIIDIDASGRIKINTSDQARNGIAANSFYLALSGDLSILKVLNFSASFSMIVLNYAWRVDFSASISFFGIFTLNGSGWFDSDGDFDVRLSGSVVIGSRSNGLVGGINFHVWMNETSFGISASAHMSARLFGISFGGVSFGFTFTANRDAGGRIKVRATVSVCIEFLFWEFCGTASFTLGYLQLPKPVYLAGLENNPEEWVGADAGGDGVLYLNMGSRASSRNIAEDDPDETYVIQHVGGSSEYPEGEIVKVVGFGRTQRFTGVKKIVANAGDGDDLIVFQEGVDSPVSINGGSGNDTIVYDGVGVSGDTSFIWGDSGNDTITIGDAFQALAMIFGGSGNDLIEGSPVADMIFGDSGHDQLIGGRGNDTISDSDGMNVIIGGLGNDTINGGSGIDLIAGDEANFDWQTGVALYSLITSSSGLGGTDTINGGDGDDFILGGFALDTISGGSGRDLLIGDEASIDFNSSGQLDFVATIGANGSGELLNGDNGDDVLVGGVGSDTLNGGSDHDLILGDNGSLDYTNGVLVSATSETGNGGALDFIYGESGDDRILAGDGVDVLWAGSGHDIVFGDNGRILQTASGALDFAESSTTAGGAGETLNGESGNDILIGGDGLDILNGGDDHDTLISADATLDWNSGVLARIASLDFGSGHNEPLYGHAGNDILIGGSGSDTLYGSTGDDVLFGDHAELIYTNGALTTARSISTTIGDVDVLYGEADNDRLIGGVGAETILFGADGNDVVIGDSGELTFGGGLLVRAATYAPGDGAIDLLNGDNGDDVLFGGTAADTLYGASGNDVLIGDQGAVEFTNNRVTRVTTNDGGANEYADDRLETSTGNNVAFGGLGADTIITLEGNDVIAGDQATLVQLESGVWIDLSSHDFARGGNDTIQSGTGDDTIVGGQGNDTVTADLGHDVIFGDSGQVVRTSAGALDLVLSLGTDQGGDDTVFANAGDDLVIAGFASDTVYGSTGNDRALGDNGRVDFADGVIVQLNTISPSHGAADTLHGDEDDDTLVGGTASDTVRGHTGNDLLVGDQVVLDFTTGNLTQASTNDGADSEFGDDVLDAANGSNVVLAGLGSDQVTALEGADWIAGDQATLIQLVHGARSLFISHDTARGGLDSINAGAGNDTIIAGQGSDTVNGEDGDDILIGDNGQIDYNASVLVRIQTISPSHGASDTLNGHADNDLVLGGTAGDTITTHTGNDTVIGDQGIVSYTNGNRVQITTNDGADSEYGDDTIHAGNGDNIVFGGLGSDDITTLEGADLVSGDQVTLVLLENGLKDEFFSHDTARGGNDLIHSGAGDDTIIAGQSVDTVHAEQQNDIVIGDNGRIDYLASVLVRIHTTSPSDGMSDTLNGNEDDDILFGGTTGDTISSHTGNDIVIGDQGVIDYTNGNLTQITTNDGVDTEFGDDVIDAGNGNNFVFAGLGSDRVDSFEGRDVITGDQATLVQLESGVWISLDSHDFTRGGNDIIRSGAGDDLIIAGHGLDDVAAEADNDMVFGDNGQVVRTNAGALDLAISVAPDQGANDLVTGNEGDDLIIAGAATDTIYGNAGDDTIIGDNGRVDYNSSVLVQINTINPSIGAVDTLNGNEDDDIIFGGTAGDTISSHTGNDIVIGDQGIIDYTNGNLTQITTNDGVDTEFGVDLIDAGNGNNIVFAGLGGDDVTSFEGQDVIAGDQATMVVLESGIWISVTTHDFTRGGNDVIRSGAGDDVVLAGNGQDEVIAGADDDIVLGDNGLMLRHNNGARSFITTTNPTLGNQDLIFGDEQDDIIFGGTAEDEIYGGSENDLIFGDHGKVDYSLPPNDNFHSIDMAVADLGADDFIRGNSGDDIIIAGQGDDTVYGDANDDDIIGGHNVAGGIDELDPADATNDRLDGGSENDVIAGDNAWIIRRGDAVSPRVRQLAGTTLYNTDGSAAVTGAAQAIPTGAASRDILLLDHSTSATADTYGNDFIAGGAHDDLIFGQLGPDILQGDSTIDHSLAAGSLSQSSDGDDYIEGNGGDDLIYGNLGQDDILGGNSDMFGLVTPAQRPDGSDVIYGGSALDLARNTMGDQSPTGHARDADMILGDNGRIYRIIGKGSEAGSYRTFNYDNYSSLRIIPRAIDLLDYSANAVASDDIGAGDLIHGEAGDDWIHGASGNDVLYGEGQDDDIFGESGDDWISGGSGDDGILGDDGKIMTSRNGTAEPLYGIAATTQTSITSKSVAATYTLNETGLINKSVDLEPFDIGGKDIIYGGLGNDFLHGGFGDDAISGAEALLEFYANPATTPGIVYDPVTREFTAYNENDPLRKVAGHALNFEAFVGDSNNKVNDGRDALFGDLGNDWLVGGTEADHLFGGLGDDLLNCDDNLETNGGANNAPDAGLYGDADLAYGGGGMDYLLGNTGGDRMIDSHGEFNNYWVPFSPYGAATIIRALNPDTRDLLYAVSKSDGADQTRVGGTLGSPARNGEPFGEIGLVMQGDAEAGDQTGAPTDPQPGNGKSRKDVR
ncbi:MAG: hypothetical protein AB1813_00100 [Verrucomicrobiota bacterium]